MGREKLSEEKFSSYHSTSNFSSAFLFLRPKKRKALSEVYGYCRAVDDIADSNQLSIEEKKDRLNFWEQEIKRTFQKKPTLHLTKNLLESIIEFNLDREHFLMILDGVRKDLYPVEYSTFEELKSYMYLVACAVGFLCLKIFGWTGPNSRKYATCLGYAVQLTNIIRDVAIDFRMNRIYIPYEDMQKFGYTKTDLKNLIYNNNFIALMKFEAGRAFEFYKKANELVEPGYKKNLLPVFIMAETYRTLLCKIEKSDFKVFDKKVSLKRIEKISSIIKALLHR